MSTPQSAILAHDGPLALFLILHLKSGADGAVREIAHNFSALLEETAAQNPGAQLYGALSFGSELWQRLSGSKPAQLRPFADLKGTTLQAPATGGDLLLHLHSARADLNYLVARQLADQLRPWIRHAEETHSFRYLDARDLSGFIDGTENPQEHDERAAAALIGDEDSQFTGGSYVIAQRYVHQLENFHTLPQAEQEGIIGRTRPDSVELGEDIMPATAHVARVVIEEEGEELEIVRHSLPYGSASGEHGLFFIAYSREQRIFELMLERMFGLSEDGLHDRLMEFTQAASSGYFYAPTLEQLRSL